MKSGLTGRHNDPNEIQEEVIAPEVVSLWPTVGQTIEIMIKHASGIIEDIPVDVSDRHNDLKRVTEGILCHNEVGKDE